ncbi:MAG TPA: alginate export family protein [Stenotrophomonas sp.]
MFAALAIAASPVQSLDACAQAAQCDRFENGGTLALDASLRLRGLYYDPSRFGIGASEDGYGLLRALGSADWRTGHWQGYVQLGVHGEQGRDGGPGGTDQGALEAQQAYVAWQDGQARWQLGRQEISYGSARLLSVRDGPNIRLAFDGARAAWHGEHARVDALVLRPVDNRSGAFDDRSDQGQFLAGVYATFAPLQAAPMKFDAYVLRYGRDDARFGTARGEELRTTLGTRWFGQAGGWDWNNEFAYQSGTLADAGRHLDIAAWTIATDNGYRWSQHRWQPRVGLKVDVASGDGDPGDHHLQTFNALYPKAAYFSEASLLAPANLIDAQPSLSLQPRPDLTLVLGTQLAWKQRRADAIYVTPTPLTPLPGSTGTARRIGTQYKLETSWQASAQWLWQWQLAWIDASEGLRQAGGRNTAFASIVAAWQW